MEPTQTTKSNNTLMVSIGIIILILIAGFFVLQNKSLKYEDRDENTIQLEGNIDENNLSDSDETSAIEADLNNNSDIDTIDSDFQ